MLSDVCASGRVRGQVETERLARLAGYGILDTEPEPGFDALTAIAASICGTPMALVSLVDAERQWFKSRVGMDLCSTSRDISFCQYTILAAEPLIIPDTHLDRRVADSPLVTGAPWLRFYAGAPLMTSDGYAIGSLCVLDVKPRDLTTEQISMLTSLAALVVDQLELRRTSLVLLDAADQASARETLIASQRQQDAVLLSTLVEGVVVQDLDGAIVECNAAATRILGLHVDDLTGLTSFDTRWHAVDEGGRDLPGERHPAIRVLHEAVPVGDFTMGVTGPDGKLAWLRVNSAPIFDEHGHLVRVVSGFADITDRKNAEDYIVFLSEHDPLTGIANRTVFGDRLRLAVSASHLTGVPAGVIYLDLDGFKQINDTDGHSAGDELLIAASARLSAGIRPGDTVARMGGDEFTVICPHVGTAARLRQIADRLLNLIREPYPLTVGTRRLSASIGVALSDKTTDAEHLLAAADSAMYTAKNSGKNRVDVAPPSPAAG